MMRFISLVYVLTLLVAPAGFTQNVSFTGSSKTTVAVGEKFNLVYTLNAEGENFRGPAMPDFNVLSGPFTSSSSNIQIINGQLSKSVELTFTYVLSAVKEGVFDIPAATVTVGGKQYRSNIIKIQVVKGASQQTPGQGRNQQDRSSGGISLDKDVFLRAIADKKNPMQGEQVIVTYKIYTKVPISHIDIQKLASFPGFWSQNLLKENEQLKQYTEYINGEEYVVADVRKVALFAQKTGKLTIEPLEMECVAQVRQQSQKRTRDPFFDSFFNDPFFNRYQNVELNLKSNPLTLDIKPLPSQNRPADFNGSVGNFSFNATINKTNLKSNEAVNLKIVIAGTGNIELIENPVINFPPDFEVYDPKVSLNINTGNTGVSGQKTYEYLIIPRQPGSFRINPVRFSYFDLAKNAYVTHTSPEFALEVEKGDGQESQVTYSGVNQEDIKFIGTDIRYIKPELPVFKLINNHFFNSSGFYLLLAAPVVLFLLFIMLWKKELKKRSNLALMKNRKATKVALKRLKNAHLLMKENKADSFYIEISQALWGYLSDKFSIPLAELSSETAHQYLEKEAIDSETAQSFLKTVEETEFARFAPGEAGKSMQDIYERALNAITQVEKELSRK
ncbi:MAG: protein BatD [Bacteroidales bacterium]|nr:protein BatD [Bacteroidales bacterium]